MPPVMPRGFVSRSRSDLWLGSPVSSARSGPSTPRESVTMTSPTPAVSRMRVTATPAAPAPATTTVRSVSDFSTTLDAPSRAASATIAVPCWSSWKTGMSSRACRRRSISKHRGAEMSSRLIPP